MFNKLLWAPAILSVAGLLVASNAAFAQHGSHSHSSSAHISSGHSNSFHANVQHGSTIHHGDDHRHSYYPGFFGGYGLGAYGVGGYGLGAYSPWYDNYSYPRYSYYNVPAVQYYTPPVDYFTPPAPYYVPPRAATADSATVRVILPDPQARVWFDGTLTNQTGTERVFSTPSLTMGSTYSYEVRASWLQGGQELTQRRAISVTPGQTTVVDFTR